MSIALPARATKPVTIWVDGAKIHATLTVPDDARGLVIFAHSSGSSRHNPHNQELARLLNDASLATSLCDLLTTEEEAIDRITGEFRFNAELMANRLNGVIDWCVTQPGLRRLPMGLFGAGTCASSACISAVARKNLVRAIVVRSGRLDLATGYLPQVEAPTLLVAGERDTPIRAAYLVSMQRLKSATKELLIIPRAGHLFQEPGTREQLSEHAAKWFGEHLAIVDDAAGGWTTEAC